MTRLEEELEAIEAIYPGSLEKIAHGEYILEVPDRDLFLRLEFPEQYPDKPPKLVSLVKGEGFVELWRNALENTYQEGVECIYDYIQNCIELLPEPEEQLEEDDTVEIVDVSSLDPFEGWTACDPVVDRKSTFIGHVASVNTVEEAENLIDHLIQDKRIARATHNIIAWRIKDGNTMYQDCDDDGETAAGGRLLHLLQAVGAINVVVVVSRWYGGIHLGPDRFKHINNCGRMALEKAGFIKN